MKNFKTVIFWGALWGLLEASLGWVLHLIHFKGEVLLLYPFGLMCMLMAFRQTEQFSTIFKVALVASLIKLVNLFMLPVVPAFHVVNPAVAIALEGLVTWAFCIYHQRSGRYAWLSSIPVASVMMLGTLILFRGWQVVMDAFTTHNPSVHTGIDPGLLFKWGWRSMAQGFMLVGMVYLTDKRVFRFHTTGLVNKLAFPLLVLAVLANILIMY